MNYLFSDFYFLVGAADKQTSTVGDAFRHLSELLAAPVPTPCLLHALRGLSTGGYITVSPEGGMITPDTPLAITDSGKKAAVPSGLRKLMGEEKALNRLELEFCGRAHPDSADGTAWTADEEGFAEITRGMMERREIFYPLFQLTEAGEELLTLTVHHPSHSYSAYEADGEGEEADNPFDPDAAAYAESVSVTGSRERVMEGVSHLLEAAHALLTQPASTRKVALHGQDQSLIITLAHAASESGITLRMTVAKIRFNRQRFYGKRDGDLDYAQCGEPVILHEMGGSAAFAALLLPCAASMPGILGEDDAARIGEIHRILKK